MKILHKVTKFLHNILLVLLYEVNILWYVFDMNGSIYILYCYMKIYDKNYVNKINANYGI